MSKVMTKVKKLAVKIKNGLNKVLVYTRVNDEKGLMSLTNVTMLVVIYKMAMTPAVSFEDLTGLALGVIGYQTKRIVDGIKKKRPEEEEL